MLFGWWCWHFGTKNVAAVSGVHRVRRDARLSEALGGIPAAIQSREACPTGLRRSRSRWSGMCTAREGVCYVVHPGTARRYGRSNSLVSP
jgi:hypothetical protein